MQKPKRVKQTRRGLSPQSLKRLGKMQENILGDAAMEALWTVRFEKIFARIASRLQEPKVRQVVAWFLKKDWALDKQRGFDQRSVWGLKPLN